VRRHVELAREFASWVAADPRFELSAPVTLSLVCFRLRAGDDAVDGAGGAADAANQRLLDDLNASGRVFLTHTRLGGRLVLRLAVGATGTERRHVEAAWSLIRDLAAGSEPVTTG
jgi:aromatic-L-amino-acid decarboxylase